MKRNGMRRPRAWLAPTTSGRLGSSSGPTTWLCRFDGWTRTGRRPAKAGRIRDAPAPILSRKHDPLAQNRRQNNSQACADCASLIVERRKATRFLIAREAKHDICASRRSMPLTLQGRDDSFPRAKCARAMARGYLTIESEGASTSCDATLLSPLPPRGFRRSAPSPTRGEGKEHKEISASQSASIIVSIALKVTPGMWSAEPARSTASS